MAQSCISFAAPAQVRKWQILLQKSFPLVTKNSPGCRRDFRVKMWGTSSPDDKLAGDLARATEATKIAGRRSDRLLAGKLSPRNFGLLQQNRHGRDMPTRSGNVWSSSRSRPNPDVLPTAVADSKRKWDEATGARELKGVMRGRVASGRSSGVKPKSSER